MNNFFFFATNEFSQNAFLCWCLNWIQFPGQPLYPMAKELIEYFAGRSLGLRRQTTIRQQMKDIGILVVPKGMNLALIIEDKVMPLEYNEQIAAYQKALRELPEWMMKDMGLTTSAEIRTVFFNAGFQYDRDRDAVADVKVDGPAFLALVQKYAGNSEILDAYIEYLRLSLSWYDDNGRYDEILTDDFWEWSISEHTIAQCRFMQTLFRQRFPESMRRRGNECFMLRNGTDRRGRPWTRFAILEDTYPASQQGYCLYWQISADKDGPHLALIFYERFSKKNEVEMIRHNRQYEMLRSKAAQFLGDHPELKLDWDEVRVRHTGTFYESTILSINLMDILCNWSTAQEELLRQQAVALSELVLAG